MRGGIHALKLDNLYNRSCLNYNDITYSNLIKPSNAWMVPTFIIYKTHCISVTMAILD